MSNNSKYTIEGALASIRNKGAFIQGNEVTLRMKVPPGTTPSTYGIRLWAKIDFLKQKGYVIHL